MTNNTIRPDNYKGGFAEIASELYSDSAFTFVGLRYEPTLLEQINKSLTDYGLNPVEQLYVYSGKDMNEHYGLTGDNQYQDDLSFVSFKLDNQPVGKLAAFKMTIGARWFDDIVDNNTRRQNNDS